MILYSFHMIFIVIFSMIIVTSIKQSLFCFVLAILTKDRWFPNMVPEHIWPDIQLDSWRFLIKFAKLYIF